MNDEALSQWIVKEVFPECLHSVKMVDGQGLCTCGTVVQGYYEKTCHENENLDLCTPDGAALLKQKAIELGVWDEFYRWLWGGGTRALRQQYEILTTPRLFAEAFRAYWEQRVK